MKKTFAMLFFLSITQVDILSNPIHHNLTENTLSPSSKGLKTWYKNLEKTIKKASQAQESAEISTSSLEQYRDTLSVLNSQLQTLITSITGLLVTDTLKSPDTDKSLYELIKIFSNSTEITYETTRGSAITITTILQEVADIKDALKIIITDLQTLSDQIQEASS